MPAGKKTQKPKTASTHANLGIKTEWIKQAGTQKPVLPGLRYTFAKILKDGTKIIKDGRSKPVPKRYDKKAMVEAAFAEFNAIPSAEDKLYIESLGSKRTRTASIEEEPLPKVESSTAQKRKAADLLEKAAKPRKTYHLNLAVFADELDKVDREMVTDIATSSFDSEDENADPDKSPQSSPFNTPGSTPAKAVHMTSKYTAHLVEPQASSKRPGAKILAQRMKALASPMQLDASPSSPMHLNSVAGTPSKNCGMETDLTASPSNMQLDPAASPNKMDAAPTVGLRCSLFSAAS